MKINIATCFLAAALALGTSGCAILNQNSKKDGAISGATGTVTSERTVTGLDNGGKKLTPPKVNAKKEKTKKKKNKKENNAATSDRTRQPLEPTATAPVTETSVSTSSVSTQSQKVATTFVINGEWTIYSVRGNVITGEERPYLTFDLAAHRFYGNNGCNYINGDLTTDSATQSLRLDNVIATMKMCHDAPYEYMINLAVSDVRSYAIRQEPPVTFLELKGTGGHALMTLRRHNMDFLNGAWRVMELNGKPLTNEENTPSLTFNIPELRLHGTTGCNIVNGDIFIDPDKTHSLQLVRLATTRRRCRPQSRETEFLLALEEVESAYLLPSGLLELQATDGHTLFTLEPLPLRPALEE